MALVATMKVELDKEISGFKLLYAAHRQVAEEGSSGSLSGLW